MKDINYKQFISASKFVVNFKQFNFRQRLVFYIEAPFRYRKFRKNVIKESIEKKEVI